MKDITGIPAPLLRQIYIKNGKFIKFTDKFNRKLFNELMDDPSIYLYNVVSYILPKMKCYEGDLIKTITIELDYNNPLCRKRISTDKGRFYKAINECISRGILYKLEPRVYIVSMDYICVMNNSQKSLFHSMVHSRLNPMDITQQLPEQYIPHVE